MSNGASIMQLGIVCLIYNSSNKVRQFAVIVFARWITQNLAAAETVAHPTLLH